MRQRVHFYRRIPHLIGISPVKGLHLKEGKKYLDILKIIVGSAPK